jgi:serine/threonine-protein kinase HipA
MAPDNICVFEYDKKFLESGFSISPFHLPLKAGVFTAKREPFEGLFGVFNDSLPDGWGRLLIDRLLLKHKINPQSLSPLDRLAIVGKNGMGAVEYHPADIFFISKDSIDIAYLAKEVKNVLNENYSGRLELLAKKEGSSGGARPKVLLNIGGEEWLIKFPGSSDPDDIGKIEYEYSLAAKECAITMPETKLFEGRYFGVKRFDRAGAKKIHMHTAAGLVYADYRLPSLDYSELFKATLALTNDMGEVMKLYRQMVFNVVTSNRDDHAKNFSFVYKSGQWRVSPAYDIVRSYGFNGQHTTTINGNGLPDKNDILSVANEVGINKNQATKIFDEIKEKAKALQRFWK